MYEAFDNQSKIVKTELKSLFCDLHDSEKIIRKLIENHEAVIQSLNMYVVDVLEADEDSQNYRTSVGFAISKGDLEPLWEYTQIDYEIPFEVEDQAQKELYNIIIASLDNIILDNIKTKERLECANIIFSNRNKILKSLQNLEL